MNTLMLALVAVQVVDIALHAATGQLEMMRVIASLVLAAGAYWSVHNPKQAWLTLTVCNAVYAVLNVIFVSQNGAVNPDTDSTRIALLLFVTGSLGLSIALRLKLTRG